MKVGAEPKKVAVLGVLLVVAAWLMYTNLAGEPDYGIPPEARRKAVSSLSSGAGTAPVPDAGAAVPAPAAPAGARLRDRRRGVQPVQEWVPRVGGRRPEDRADPAATDPTLRVDLLARLQTVALSGGQRSLFDFSAAPVPKVEDVIIKPGAGKKSGAPKTEPPPPDSPEARAAEEPPKPPPPPIPFRFFGFVEGSGEKRGFFLNGEDVFAATEGQLLQARYRVVRIGRTSAVVEDTQHKHEQTIPIEEMPAGGA